ncbi:MAG: MFS transporter [Cellulomonadaceae bacterium]
MLTDLASLLRLPDFRRLFSVRIASQCADGMFQIGLATLFFFSPERQSSAPQVALAFAVLLLPFTIVGPWAGVFLDRWRRRQVLLYGNLIRAVLSLLVAALMLATPAGQGLGPAVYVLALLNLSINRFLLSALSAGLPRVVDGPLLITANSLIPTLGAVSAGVGAALGFVLGMVLPDGRLQDAAAVVVAAGLMTVAGMLATRLGRDRLGPDRTDAVPVATALRHLALSLRDGARYVVRRATPGQALAVMCVGRFLFGAMLVATILISRNLLTDQADTGGGLRVFATILAATGAGFGAAIVATPALAPRLGVHRWIVICLAVGAVAQALLVVHLNMATMLVSGAALGLSSQGAKIAVDTIVQRDTDDAFRGRAFALYDVLYNAGLVGAAALAAATLPDDGYAPVVFALLALAYCATAFVFGRYGATTPRAVPAA